MTTTTEAAHTAGLAKIADKIAGGTACSHETDWDGLRDCIDTATGGEFDAFQLDLLTDMVTARRAAAEARANG